MTTAAVPTYTIPQNPNPVLDSKISIKVEIFDVEIKRECTCDNFQTSSRGFYSYRSKGQKS